MALFQKNAKLLRWEGSQINLRAYLHTIKRIDREGGSQALECSYRKALLRSASRNATRIRESLIPAAGH
jgi:hypothetical protein